MPEMAHPVGLHRLAADFYLIGQQARSVFSPSLLLIRVFIIGVRAGACPVDTLQAMQADSSPTCDAHTTHTLTPNMTHTLFCCPVAPMQIMGRLRTIQEDTASLQRHRVDYDNNGQPPTSSITASVSHRHHHDEDAVDGSTGGITPLWFVWPPADLPLRQNLR